MPIFAGTGSSINFNSSDVTLTHGTDQLIVSGGYLVVTGSNGRLGVQTAAPISELDVSGKIAISLESTTPSAPAAGKGFLYSKAGGGLYWRSADLTEVNLTNTASPISISDTDADTRIHCEESADEDKIRFDTFGSERMIIDNTGKVGVATSSPSQLLHVSTANDGEGILAENSSTGGAFEARYVAGGAYGYQLKMDDNTNTTTIFLRSYGDSYFNTGGSFGLG